MKQKGFTLIELLAVIAILAIIAIITTPTILNVINDSRKKAAEDKAWGTIDAVKISYAQAQTTGYSEATDSAHGITYDSTNKTLTVDFSSDNIAFGTTPITMSGDRPTSGTVTIDLSTGQVTAKDLVFKKNGEYVCNTNSSSTMNCEVHTYVYAWNTSSLNYSGASQSLSSAISPSYNSFAALNTATGKTIALKYGIENNFVTEAYACFLYNSEEVCLQGSTDGSTFAANKQILNEKLGCNCTDSSKCECSAPGLYASANSNGAVGVAIPLFWTCYANNESYAGCYKR